MADVKFNFNSEWPTIQVARVIHDPSSSGETDSRSSVARKHRHGLGYPPLAVSMEMAGSGYYSRPMQALEVDSNYVYIPAQESYIAQAECAVIYAVDISETFSYAGYDSEVGVPLQDTSDGTMDLRDFLLHSRAVGPMLLDVATKTFTVSDTTLQYTSPLDYPTFVFGYVKWSETAGADTPKGVWQPALYRSQTPPSIITDGFESVINRDLPEFEGASIVSLRNPAVISHNTVNTTL